VKIILSSHLGDILVAANPSSLEGLAGQLLALEGDEMSAEGELIDGGFLAAEVEDADLGIRHTTAVAGLGVWLVLTVAVAVVQ